MRGAEFGAFDALWVVSTQKASVDGRGAGRPKASGALRVSGTRKAPTGAQSPEPSPLLAFSPEPELDVDSAFFGSDLSADSDFVPPSPLAFFA